MLVVLLSMLCKKRKLYIKLYNLEFYSSFLLKLTLSLRIFIGACAVNINF